MVSSRWFHSIIVFGKYEWRYWSVCVLGTHTSFITTCRPYPNTDVKLNTPISQSHCLSTHVCSTVDSVFALVGCGHQTTIGPQQTTAANAGEAILTTGGCAAFCGNDADIHAVAMGDTVGHQCQTTVDGLTYTYTSSFTEISRPRIINFASLEQFTLVRRHTHKLYIIHKRHDVRITHEKTLLDVYDLWTKVSFWTLNYVMSKI